MSGTGRGTVVRHATAVSAGIALLGLLAAPHLANLFLTDEVGFVKAGIAVTRTGRPLFYFDEGLRSTWGVWHPPTYVYYFSLLVDVVGVSEPALRGGTFLFALLTVPFLYLLAVGVRLSDSGASLRESWRRSPYALPAVAVLVFVTSPYVVQNGVLIDLNGSVLMFLTAGFLSFVVLSRDAYGLPKRYPYLGVAVGFALVAATKFDVLPSLFVSVTGVTAVADDVRSAVREALSMALGFGFFVVSWYGVASALGLPFLMPFAHNLGMASDLAASESASLAHRLLTSGYVLYSQTLWVSVFLLALAGLAVLSVFDLPPTRPEFRRTVANHRSVLLLGAFAFALFAQFVVLGKIAYWFPKYVGPAMPAFSVVAAYYLGRTVPAPQATPRIWKFGTGCAAAVAAITFALPDPFALPFEAGNLELLAFAAKTTLAGIALTALVVLAGVVVWSRATRNFGSIAASADGVVPLLLLALLMGTNVGFVATQATADYTTSYMYGEEGMERTIDAIDDEYAALPAEEQASVVAPKDVGFYLGQYRYVRGYSSAEFRRKTPPILVSRVGKHPDVVATVRSTKGYDCHRIGSFVACTRADETAD